MSQFSPFQSPDGTVTDYGHSINVSSSHAAAARERDDLVASKTPLSLWVLIPICGVVLAAGSYLGVNLGWGPNLKGYTYELTPPAGGGPAAAELPPYDPKVWLAKGKAEYGTVCITCHLASGEGQAGIYPPLKGSEWVLQGEERLVSLLLHGISGPITVEGKSYNGVMPAQGAAKNDKALGQLASYIRNEWGNSGSLIYDDQVKVVRDKLAGMGEASFSEAALLKIDVNGNLPPSKRPAEAAAAGSPAGTAAAPSPAAAAPSPAAAAPAPAAAAPAPAAAAPAPAAAAPAPAAAAPAPAAAAPAPAAAPASAPTAPVSDSAPSGN